MDPEEENGKTRASRDPLGAEAEQYREDLHRYLISKVRNKEVANDLAQEAYLRYLAVPNVRVLHKPDAYLFRIAVNLIREWRLRRDRSTVTFDSKLVDQAVVNLADAGADSLRELVARQQLERMLVDMPAKYREALIMNKVLGLDYKEIAKKLEVAPHTVIVYLSRALAHARGVQLD